jgi:hypothetical protein
MWFETLTGFREDTPTQVRDNLSADGGLLRSHINDKEYVCGFLETPSLVELRERIQRSELHLGKISVREVNADAQQLHIDESNAGALFQVASQFNLLEMATPHVSPEHGIDRYEHDNTQGPACAIAAGAGTIYRNYFVDVNGVAGQTSENQIDCLADIGAKLGNSDNRLWEMKNGYALASKDGLKEITNILKSSSESEIDELRKLLRIGIQWDTQVTLNDSKHTVTQAYCSSFPVSYSQHPPELWSSFAQVILEASYEATLCSGILNSIKTGNKRIFLTLVGGGAFGNDTTWIINAIRRTLKLYQHLELDVVIVSHGRSNIFVQELVRQHQ